MHTGAMSAQLTIRSTALGACLVLHPPTDPHSRGYVWEVEVELWDQGIEATGTVDIAYPPRDQDVDLVEFVRRLADEWRGWSGIRQWQSMDGRLRLEAKHDGIGHVSVGVTLTGPIAAGLEESWSARVVVVLEAGEQMRSLGMELSRLFAPEVN